MARGLSPSAGGRMKASTTLTTGNARRIIAQMLGRELSRQTIVRLIEAGALQGFRLYSTAQWCIDRDSLLKYVQRIRKEFSDSP